MPLLRSAAHSILETDVNSKNKRLLLEQENMFFKTRTPSMKEHSSQCKAYASLVANYLALGATNNNVSAYPNSVTLVKKFSMKKTTEGERKFRVILTFKICFRRFIF